jgi:hypothetical protein
MQFFKRGSNKVELLAGGSVVIGESASRGSYRQTYV